MITHDTELEGVCCFRKKAIIPVFGLLPEFRSKGISRLLIEEAEKCVKEQGAEVATIHTQGRSLKW